MSKQNQFNFDVKNIGEEGYFAGYASVFGIIDSQQDIILQGAFAKTITENKDNIKLLWQHKTDEPIGNIISLKEDSYGLYVEGKLLLDVEKAREAYSLLKSGSLNGMSIGYKVKEVEYDEITDIRFIKEVELFEISLVTFPSNQNAKITTVKNDTPNTIREYERFLRKNGFSRNEAKEIALYGYKAEEVKSLQNSFDRAINTLSISR